MSSSFFRFFSVQLRLQPDPVPFLQLQDGTSRSLLVAISASARFVPGSGCHSAHETHLDSTLKQLNVKAKVVHTRDAAGEHTSGRVEVVLLVVQNFLEDNGLGGSWERPTQQRKRQTELQGGHFSTSPGSPGSPSWSWHTYGSRFKINRK